MASAWVKSTLVASADLSSSPDDRRGDRRGPSYVGSDVQGLHHMCRWVGDPHELQPVTLVVTAREAKQKSKRVDPLAPDRGVV